MPSTQRSGTIRRILLVDGEGERSENLRIITDGFGPGCHVATAPSAEDGLMALRREKFDFIMLDLPTLAQAACDMEQTIANISRRAAGALMIAISETGALSGTMMAMRAGVHDCLTMPFDGHDLAARVDELVLRHGKAGAAHLDTGACAILPSHGFVGHSAPMQVIYGQISRVAASDAPVFITGESGTGKQHCARALHAASDRADGPLIAVNCASIGRDLLETELFGVSPGTYSGMTQDEPGAIELAEGGTLFVAEIGAMDLGTQAKFLRLLQTQTSCRVGESGGRPANARVICATSANPMYLIAQRRLREDLFYRLHVLPIYMPPLRQRTVDILPLAQHFLSQYSAEECKAFEGFTEDAEALLVARDWPGNVRQLQNLMRRIVVMSSGGRVSAAMIDAADFEAQALKLSIARTAPCTPHILPMWRQEQKIIEDAITHFAGNISQAAIALEISPSTIYRKRQVWEQMGRDNPGQLYVA